MSNMNENIITIGQIGRVVTGKTPPTSNQEYFEGDYPFITPTDIGTFYEKYLNTTERTISNEGVKILKSCIIPANSVCFVSIGSTIGKMCYTNKQSFTNQQINSIVVNDNFDSEYIFYYLRYIRSYFMSIGSGTGSGKGIVNKSTFCNTKVKIEMNKDVQKSISNVLSTYDSLIENNNKRIKILEQMAEELYKEWFVRFRFPEYKDYKFKHEKPKGWLLGTHNDMKIPQDWSFGKVENIGNFSRGKNITKEQMIEGNVPVISAGIEPSGYHNASNVKGMSLTMSASGANAGYLKYNLDDIWAADCSYYQDDSNIWFMYHSLNFIRKAIDNLQVGSAQPHVYPKNINKLCIMVPEEKYIKKFNELVSPVYLEIKRLQEKNKNLEKQRDLLLPRFMSGKLEVK